MISLEQVKLLESKVTRTIDYVKKVTDENSKLKEKLDSYQKRIDDLEVLIQRFNDDQTRIEDGIISALDRLNQFEDIVENKPASRGKPAEPRSAPEPSGKVKAPENENEGKKSAEKKKAGLIAESLADDEKNDGPETGGVELDIF
jgi:predicted nuclease with TOPRIM domain